METEEQQLALLCDILETKLSPTSESVLLNLQNNLSLKPIEKTTPKNINKKGITNKITF